MRQILMYAIDNILCPLDAKDSKFHCESVSLKKPQKRDCSWSTMKLVLGWIIDTKAMTIHLLPHRVKCLAEMLASIPITQKRTNVKMWHKDLG